MPTDLAPPVLESRAREILKRAGHEAKVVDTKSGILIDSEYFRHVRATDESPQRWDGLATGRPPAIYFWHRESPRPLVSEQVWGLVRIDSPPRTLTGMSMVIMDGE